MRHYRAYVSETVMTAPDPSVFSWGEIYEAPVYGGELQEPISEPGMCTDYNRGSTREEQPAMYRSVSRKNGAGVGRTRGTIWQ